ncbi:hypothetical protein WJX81_006190 [Elliptochloris bilobata]|uniref:Uncharacterized protein n=1 Tax=Elliptochloris bilobata TaxID=381761 RepID=A0AAW1QL85_9CHLO
MAGEAKFLAFKAAGNKVKVLVYHPVQPWLAYADGNQTVTVWDWSSQQVVWEAGLGTSDDALMQDCLLQKLAERQPGYYGSAEPAPGAKGAAPGAVRALMFLDTHVAFWQLALQHSRQYRAHSSAGLPHLERVRGLRGARWLVAACETKLLLLEVGGEAPREVPRAVLDGKAPTQLALLLNVSPLLLGYGVAAGAQQALVVPVLAVGTAAGTTFLLSSSALQVHAKLVGGHKGAVTALVALAAPQPGGADLLLSAGADGTIALWEPSAAPPREVDREVSPKATFKAHEGEVLAMQLFQDNSDSPDPGPLRLITSGEDKRVAVWEVGSWKEVARTRPLARGAADALAVSARAGAPTGAQPSVLLASGERAAIWGLFPTSRQLAVAQQAALDSVLPAGHKKAPKIYALACHPLQPHLVAVGANAGFRGCQYLMASESQLWHIAYRPGWSEGPSGRQLTADLSFKRSVAAIDSALGSSELAVSFDGRFASLAWPEAREYAIFAARPDGTWTQIARGAGVRVAWAAVADDFAVLHVLKAAALQDPKLTRRRSRGREQEVAAAAAAAVAAAAAAAAANTAVEVWEVTGEGGVRQLVSNIVMGSDVPVGLHGGAALGVTFSRQLRPASGRRGRAMRLYSWRTGEVCSEVLVAPRWLAWAPDGQALALAYPDALVLCRTQPAFSAFASLPLRGAASGVWHQRQLWVATAAEVHCVFASVDAEAAEPFLQAVCVASHSAGAAAAHAAAAHAAAALPAPGMRCAGPVVVAGVREGSLWLLDARGEPFVISLAAAGLRARMLAAAGASTAARAAAERGLARTHHDSLARWLAAAAPTASSDAGALSGLSLRTDLGLALRDGNQQEPQASSKAAFKGDDVGLDVWPACLLLADYLAQHCGAVAGRLVIELGSGVGLCGLAAAAMGAQCAALSDYDSKHQVLDVLRHNVALNDLAAKTVVEHLDWERPSLSALAGQKYDVALACDVLYASKLVPRLLAAVEHFLAPAGILLLAHQNRRAVMMDAVTRLPRLEDADRP